MNKVLTIVEVVTAILIIASILIQQKGAGLSGVFGGSDVSYLTKRGAEKVVTYLTIAFILIFIGAILLSFILV